MLLREPYDEQTALYAVMSFYDSQPINGRFEKKPHIVLTISPRPYVDEGGISEFDITSTINKAIKDGRVIDIDKNIRAELPVNAHSLDVGIITNSALENNLSDFKEKIKNC